MAVELLGRAAGLFSIFKPTPEGIPSYSREDRAARKGYKQAGAIILRGALGPEVMNVISGTWEAGLIKFDGKVRELQNGALPEDPGQRWVVDTFAKLQFLQHAVLRTNVEGADLQVPDELAKSLRHVFPRVSFIEGKSAIRRQGAQSAYVTWHRDAHAVRMTDYQDSFNCWVPMHAVGIDRPSLEIALGSHLDWRQRKVDVEAHDNPEDAEVRSTYKVVAAIMSPGDVLVFDQHTLHRTQPMEQYPVRISGEYRFTAGAA
jgi:hypothetical protein